MSRWQSVYDTDEMVRRYETRLKIVGIHVDERDKTVLDMIPFEESDSFSLLDLGAGMGRFTEKIIEKFPEASIVCLDGSAKMLDVARANLGGNEKITFVHENFDEGSWVRSVSGKFDVIVSTGALHHILDQRREHIFREIYELIGDGGYFINGDLFKSKHDVLNKKYYDDVWARYIQRKTKGRFGEGKWNGPEGKLKPGDTPEECLGAPMRGSTWGLLIGTMVVLWGVSGLVNIDFNVGAVIAVVFGAYIVINALKRTSE